MNIGDRLKQIRKEILKLNQQDLALKFEVSKQSIVRYELNQRIPDGLFLQKLNNLFNININWLLTGTGTMLLTELPIPAPYDFEAYTPLPVTPTTIDQLTQENKTLIRENGRLEGKLEAKTEDYNKLLALYSNTVKECKTLPQTDKATG